MGSWLQSDAIVRTVTRGRCCSDWSRQHSACHALHGRKGMSYVSSIVRQLFDVSKKPEMPFLGKGRPSLGSGDAKESVRDLGLRRDEKNVRDLVSGETEKMSEAWSRARRRTLPVARGLPWIVVEWFWLSLEISFRRPSCPPL